jgi:hypothetical protein
MNNWQLHVKGRYSGDKAMYLVEEIVGVVFDVDVPSSIAFINPDFFKRDTKDKSARAGFGGVNWLNNEDEFEIDDDQTGSDQNETLALEGDLSWIRFTKPFDVYKQEQVKGSSKLIMNELAERKRVEKLAPMSRIRVALCLPLMLVANRILPIGNDCLPVALRALITCCKC